MDGIYLEKDREEFRNLCTVARMKKITFTKREAIKWVGTRDRLERLIKENKIRTEKSAERQNAYWRCVAEDVLRCAYRCI